VLNNGQTLNVISAYKDPSPAWLSANTTHLSNSGGEKATKRTGESGGGEEDCCADTEFRSLVPATEVVVD
jgi:hypothetical protein|tara:strand:- start:17853 stop:18062 length:210 start_codon:yes stop_codon:yes gene_type:complete